MKTEYENRLGLAGPTGQTETKSVATPEWPAIPVKTVTVSDGNGKVVEISYGEYLSKLGNNNRGGT